MDTLLIFAASFYFTWLFYAVIYYLICWHHGDLLPENIANMQSDNVTWSPCVLLMYDFASAFLFSLVTIFLLLLHYHCKNRNVVLQTIYN